MITDRLPGSGVIRILIIFFTALQMVACSLDEATDEAPGEVVPVVPVVPVVAVISGIDSGSITEDADHDSNNLLEVSGKLDITDSDPGEAAFVAETINGSYGSLEIDVSGNWNYAAINKQAAIQSLVNGAELTDILSVSSVDGTTHDVTITITGVDETVILSWVAPVAREDNESLPLSEIEGYVVRYGTTSGQYSSSVNIKDSSAQNYTFTNLAVGDYYFSVTAYDNSGRESQYSPEVSVTVLF